jgi:hypothetical protein
VVREQLGELAGRSAIIASIPSGSASPAAENASFDGAKTVRSSAVFRVIGETRQLQVLDEGREQWVLGGRRHHRLGHHAVEAAGAAGRDL